MISILAEGKKVIEIGFEIFYIFAVVAVGGLIRAELCLR